MQKKSDSPFNRFHLPALSSTEFESIGRNAACADIVQSILTPVTSSWGVEITLLTATCAQLSDMSVLCGSFWVSLINCSKRVEDEVKGETEQRLVVRISEKNLFWTLSGSLYSSTGM